jgi:SAM-dependent methyltransferase
VQNSSKKALMGFLRKRTFNKVLDAPSGNGWLGEAMGSETTVDGIDLYLDEMTGYQNFWKFDLDEGLPKDCTGYDLICCCEGLEHVGNPLLLLRHFHRSLTEGGMLVITTPNVWYPQARIQYFMRGFFPSFPSLADKVKPGTHMHITPWSYPQLYAYFKLAGFQPPEIISEPQSKAKHFHEILFGWPAKLYGRGKIRAARTEEERNFWKTANSKESRLSRHLMAVTTKAGNESE